MLVELLLGSVFIGGIWLIVLSWLFWQLQSHYRSLLGETDKKSLHFSLDTLIREVRQTQNTVAALITRCDKIEQESSLHIQKIGLLRFNPFKDTGGDQSFILALVDAHDTGIVISGLYSRSGTRWYAKKIVQGKSTEHELSEDEKKAIRIAKSAE